MPYTITYNKEDDIIEVITNGAMNRYTAREMSTETLEMVRRKNCPRIYHDWTKVQIVGSTFDIYQFAIDQRLLGLKETDRVAVLIDRRAEEDFRFFKNIAKDQGFFNFNYFFDRDNAIKWLKEL